MLRINVELDIKLPKSCFVFQFARLRSYDSEYLTCILLEKSIDPDYEQNCRLDSCPLRVVRKQKTASACNTDDLKGV